MIRISLLIALHLCVFINASVIDLTAIDKETPACTNFYQYSCGSWLKRAEIPADRRGWDRGFSEIDERNRTILRDILELFAKGKIDKNDPETRKLADYYSACMDEKRAEEESLPELFRELDLIEAITEKKLLASTVARLHALGANVFFGFTSTQDLKDSSLMIADVDHGGLSLPDRDYYLKNEGKMPQIRKNFRQYILNMWGMLGTPVKKANAIADAVIEIETSLAKHGLDRAVRRDPYKIYHRLERTGLIKLASHFSWEEYLKTLGFPAIEQINVCEPDFIKNVADIINDTSLADLKNYLKWHTLTRLAPALPKKFVDEQFRFRSENFTGEKEIQSRWKRCVSATDQAMGEALGRSFVKKHFGNEGKRLNQSMISDIEEAFDKNLTTITWMDDKTKGRAREKLHKIVNQVGFPDKWRSYKKLEINPKSYIRNSINSAAFQLNYELEKIGKPVDRGEWHMSPPTVNAYFSPQFNKMVFPAGVLQPPFFDKGATRAANLGAIGIVMGHELTHAFDDEGRKFDGQGNLEGWWEKEVDEKFTQKATCISNQYAGYEVIDGLKLNGKLTLGENIADLGGLKLAYAAFLKHSKNPKKKTKLGISEEQEFFMAFAQAWCSKRRPEFERLLVTVDPHSPNRFRINGTLVNFPPFAQAFECSPETKMGSVTRCEVW